ncbi:MAG: cysteine protease StiP family protein [Oscillospiraceae bacterium]
MMNSSYKKEDVTILLKDISGLVEPLPAEKREPLIQSGVHYCEMLPLEYVPTKEYFSLYQTALEKYCGITAKAVMICSEKIHRKIPENLVIVSLARAGTPIGILIKRYLEAKYSIKVYHYTISIIRGKGIDHNAMKYILERHKPETIQFVDGWTGKGAILNTLKNELECFDGVSSELAVLADPANITDLCGTHDDFLIPSSCLNSTVSGLISRTFLRNDIIGKDDFHGAAYYGNLINEDRTYEFIDSVLSKIDYSSLSNDIINHIISEEKIENLNKTGAEEVKEIADKFGISDINLVKPGIGETTRVLLRRIPWKILVNSLDDTEYIGHILRLAKEKNVEVIEYPLECYRACGIIRSMADT